MNALDRLRQWQRAEGYREVELRIVPSYGTKSYQVSLIDRGYTLGEHNPPRYPQVTEMVGADDQAALDQVIDFALERWAKQDFDPQPGK